MNGSVYLMVFAICLVANNGIVSIVQAAPSGESSEQFLTRQESLKRVVRQIPEPPAPPPPPSEGDMPPPPPGSWIENNYSRKKREAKGGGSMPTRKG